MYFEIHEKINCKYKTISKHFFNKLKTPENFYVLFNTKTSAKTLR